MVDILVVGGGIAGLSVAGRLSKSANVTLLEAEENLGHHSSSRSAAAFIEDYGNDVIRDFNSASKSFLSKDGVNVLSPRGSLILGKKNEKHLFKEQCSSFAHHEISVSDARSLIEIINNKSVKYAGYKEDIYDIDTDKLLQHFTKDIKANGSKIYTNSRVIAADFKDGKWQIKTDSKTFICDVIVNAAGAWVDELALKCGIKPLGFLTLKRSMARVPAPDDSGSHKSWPMAFGLNESFYAKPDAGEMIVSPSEETESFPHDAYANEEDLAKGIFSFEEVVNFSVKRITSSWAGLRTFAPDRTLVIGFDSNIPSFFWLAGQGGYGFQTSAAASKMASEIILGKKSSFGQLQKRVSPDRFK